jgi:hypothetical protein
MDAAGTKDDATVVKEEATRGVGVALAARATRASPTTAAPPITTCLRDADRAVEKAFMIFTGRDGSGGALVTSYRTEGRGSLSVVDPIPGCRRVSP